MAVSRHFLGWNKPTLPSAVQWLIAKYARGQELDLSGVVLVLPGRRAARRLLEILVQEAGQQWPAMRPPTTVTFESLPEQLYRAQRTLADEFTQLLVWRKALFAVPELELAPAIPKRPGPESVAAWLALCESLKRLHHELAADGLEFDDVHVHLARSGHAAEAARWLALRRVQAEYLMQMDEAGLWDRQAARLVAAQQHECRTDKDIVLIGTVDIHGIIKQLLDQVSDRVTALVHAPPEDADAFDAYGCLRPEVWESRQLDIPFASLRVVESPKDQAQAALRELSAFRDGVRPDDVTIGVADDSLVPVLMQSLADVQLAGHWPIGRFLSASRPYRLLDAVAAHLASARRDQPPDFETLSELVRHPDLFDWMTRSLTNEQDSSTACAAGTWLSELDEYRAEHLQLAPGAMLGTAPRRTLVASICAGVERLLSQLLPPSTDDPNRPARGRQRQAASPKLRQRSIDELLDQRDSRIQTQLSSTRSVLDWGDGVLRLLASVYEAGELAGQVTEATSACVHAIHDLVDELRAIPRALLPDCTASQALQLMLRQIADTSLSPVSRPDAIEMLGWLDLPLDDSPILILTGFNEGCIPESINSDAFMPNSLRSQLSLTDNQRRYARDAFAMSAIMNSRQHVTLIAGRVDAQGNPTAPSRLWFAAEPQTLPDRVRQFYAPAGRDDEVATSARPDGTARRNPRSSKTVDRAGAESERPQSASAFVVPEPDRSGRVVSEIGVTAFRAYLSCPYSWFATHVLRLREAESNPVEIDALAFGNLVHSVLNAFGNSDVCDATEPNAIRDFLRDELHREALIQFGRERSATVNVQLEMLRRRLDVFSEWQAGTAAEGWRIRFLEQTLQCSDFEDVRGRRVVLKGRIDRIDQHLVDKSYRVIDYKTGEEPLSPERAHRTSGQWTDLQLPLYRQLIRELGIDPAHVQLGFVLLPGDLKQVGWQGADWSPSDLAEAEQLARTVAASMVDLRIDRVERTGAKQPTALARLCQDTVVDRLIPWLDRAPTQ